MYNHMKKADNFNPGQWLIENKLTKSSQLNEDVKEIDRQDMHSIKAPNSAVLDNGEKPFPLTNEETKIVKSFSEKPNIKGRLLKMIDLGPDRCILSLQNKKGEVRIIQYFKSDKSNYYITVNGSGDTSYNKEKYYTTDDKSALDKFLTKTLTEFSSWCDEQIKSNQLPS